VLFDHEWTLPTRMEDNPLIWIVEVNGLPVDIRNAPRHLQEIAINKGLIPYIPADRPGQTHLIFPTLRLLFEDFLQVRDIQGRFVTFGPHAPLAWMPLQ
jgi:hypothetical protein